jgi:lysyl-tRNA synthetase class 2
MKKLIAQHRRSMYQICRCFRNGESSGRFHSPEFTMLEYYTMDAGYRDSIAITEELFSRLGDEEALRPPFEQISMEEAFARWAGFDLYKAAGQDGGLEEEARRLGLNPPGALDKGALGALGKCALFDLIFIDKVEPSLPRDHPVVLMDYPAFVPCLAKKNNNGKTVERWELYVRGIELANCYSEETDPRAVREFFSREKSAKEKSALTPHKVDDDYWKVFLRSFPPCSGVALGLDRLMMVLAGRQSIDSVLPFPMAGY